MRGKLACAGPMIPYPLIERRSNVSGEDVVETKHYVCRRRSAWDNINEEEKTYRGWRAARVLPVYAYGYSPRSEKDGAAGDGGARQSGDCHQNRGK